MMTHANQWWLGGTGRFMKVLKIFQMATQAGVPLSAHDLKISPVIVKDYLNM